MLFIPGKTAALIPKFAVEDLPLAELQPWFLCLAAKDLPLGRIAVLVPKFAVKDLPLGQNTDDDDDDDDDD